ncbi:pseudaminic acid synthase [Danxiaibacter flavus]|uniref:Pseudaminic acid synthase n=1 Tax=Danxiaibacter flavus TaxID=3049108 RepID=A0ABV3ZF36_9BACT|nr:pseudaminic acid synthase [Chitinophagaceae bacterium DXS]
MKIANISVGLGAKPFIIAEMSGNHNQSLDRALSIVKAAADSKADAIKLQTYTPDSITINQHGGLFDIQDKNSLWTGRNLYDLYSEAMTPYEWHEAIFSYAAELGLICFSTPFDDFAVDLLEKLGAPCHKIASFENNHHPLLKKIAKTGKPVIMSTGVSTLGGIDESVTVLRDNGCRDLALLKCTSNYPASPANTNVKTIPHMREMFKCEIGLSDHTMGVGASVAAVSLGATIIEKHFCLSRAEGGVDSAFSLEPHEFKTLVEETERAWLSLGEVQYGIQEAERKSVEYKRSIYVVEDIAAGEKFSEKNIRIIRPGDGLHPRYYEQLLLSCASSDLKKGTPVKFRDVL